MPGIWALHMVDMSPLNSEALSDCLVALSAPISYYTLLQSKACEQCDFAICNLSIAQWNM